MDHVSVARRVPPTRYAQSAGAKIAYQVSGEGPCDLVFVSGLVSHLELQWQQLSYRRFVTALEHACRVIRFDKRGTCLSDPTDVLPSMDQRVVDLAAVMDAAGSQTAVVFGVSDGGRGAIAFAAAHPDRVLGLVLYGTSSRGPRPGNVTAPMPAGNIHVDVPSFRGADRDRYPMQLLQAMAASGLFEDWRVAEAGAVWWNYQGPGGAYDYWPDGLDGPMRSEHPPFVNSAAGRWRGGS